MGFNKDYPDEFERLWKVYPNKANKEGGYKSWKREGFGKKSENDLLINHLLERRRLDVMWLPDREGKSFIPHLQTFINQRRWHDDYEKRAQKYARANREFDASTQPMTEAERASAKKAAQEALSNLSGLLGRRP